MRQVVVILDKDKGAIGGESGSRVVRRALMTVPCVTRRALRAFCHQQLSVHLASCLRLRDDVSLSACSGDGTSVLYVCCRAIPKAQVTFWSKEAVEVDSVGDFQAGTSTSTMIAPRALTTKMLGTGEGRAQAFEREQEPCTQERVRPDSVLESFTNVTTKEATAVRLTMTL